MADFFRKLNVLLKSGLGDVADDLIPRGRVKTLDDLDREIVRLREKLRDARDHEIALKARIDSFDSQIDDLSNQSDDALKQGKVEQARYVLEQIKRLEQRREMAVADLREHQLITDRFAQQIALLDNAAAEARAVQQQNAAPPSHDDSREMPPQQSTNRTALETPAASKNEPPDDDLDQRIQRLSKR
jgi:septal ring factor EnvC (AmiA/AmiB activator)